MTLDAALAAALLLGLALPAAAQTMPAGEYSVTISGFGRPQVFTQCMAEQAVESAVVPKDQAFKECSKRDVTRSGNTITMDFACEGMTMKGTGTFSEGAYRSEMTMSGEGIPPMRMTTEVKRVGACKPGQTPMPAR